MRATMHEVPAGSEAPAAQARAAAASAPPACEPSRGHSERMSTRSRQGTTEAFENVVGTAEGAHPDGAEPAAYFRALATHPVLCCSAFGACNFFFFALTLLLTAVGMAPFDMTAMNEGNTGLTLPYDEWSERASGFLRAQNEANFAVAGLYCPRSDIDYTMQFILQHTDGANLLTKDALSYLKNSVEAHIVTDAAWPGLCVLLYDGECEVAPLMGIPTPYGTYDITDEHGCLQMTSPAYYFAKYGDADFDDIEGTISRIRSGSPTDWNTFVSLMGSDFDPDAGSPPSTSYLKSMAFLGLPFHNWTACACATVARPPSPPPASSLLNPFLAAMCRCGRRRAKPPGPARHRGQVLVLHGRVSLAGVGEPGRDD